MASTAGTPDAPTKHRSPRDTARLVGALALLALLIAFVIDNSQTVTVGFIFFKAHVSLIWVLLITALLGACVDRLVVVLRQRRQKGRQTPG